MHNQNLIQSEDIALDSSFRNRFTEEHTISSSVRIFLEIIKFKITILVSFTTGLGYILAANTISFTIFYPVLGIFLLACSASALNHYQERKTDRLMERTSRRPIPAGKIEPQSVLIISIAIFITASFILIIFSNILALAIGYLTFIWYNAIYTPLKKVTPWAIIPGSLVGALPPIAGWAAAGGLVMDSRIMIVSLYFFIWQIPHFWLLLMLYSDDYRNAGFPVLTDIFSIGQLKKITFMWLLATVLIAMAIPMFGIINFKISIAAIVLSSIWMIVAAVRFLFADESRKPVINSFIRINFYTLLLITILSLDKFFKIL